MNVILTTLFLSIGTIVFSQNSGKMKNQHCDPVTGVCTPADLPKKEYKKEVTTSQLEIIYVGDPMCSWCYGIAKDLEQLKAYGEQENIPFKIVVGGLRPGGGDAWTGEFRSFLKNEWETINERTGQEFGNKLFELDTFDYNTEPSCRALVSLRKLSPEKELQLFEAIQRKFYYDNEDPKQVEFYASICKAFDLDFNEFTLIFESEELQKETYKEFTLNREWGVKGYPTVLLRVSNELFLISNGYTPFEQLKERVVEIKENQKL